MYFIVMLRGCKVARQRGNLILYPSFNKCGCGGCESERRSNKTNCLQSQSRRPADTPPRPLWNKTKQFLPFLFLQLRQTNL